MKNRWISLLCLVATVFLLLLHCGLFAATLEIASFARLGIAKQIQTSIVTESEYAEADLIGKPITEVDTFSEISENGGCAYASVNLDFRFYLIGGIEQRVLVMIFYDEALTIYDVDYLLQYV